MGDSKLLTPGDLQKLTEQSMQAKIQEEFNRSKHQEDEQRQLREAFMTREIHPDVMERVNAAVRRAAEQGLYEIEVLKFPATYCNDRGRRINNAEPDWPDSLEGFAKRAHEFYVKELRPLKFKIRAQVLSFPEGKPGDIGLFLSW
jgi:hypothetical protein